MNGMKEHIFSYEIGPDDTYFQYTTVCDLSVAKTLHINSLLYKARVDDVELDVTCLVSKSSYHCL
jgi:hypothetical protein